MNSVEYYELVFDSVWNEQRKSDVMLRGS